MENISKVAKVIIKSYILGLALFIISAVILAIWGVTINPSYNSIKWNLCTLFIGFIIYLMKQ